MTTALFTHAACLEHDTGPGHPERVARLESVADALKDERFAALARRDAPLATRAQLEAVHATDYIDRIERHAPGESALSVHLDADTVMSQGSHEAAYRAAGGVCAAVDEVLQGAVQSAFCAIRPPGHHAEPGRPMGFCIFNSVAVAARHAQAAHGAERVAVVDFDVHHGNGTQAAFWHDASCFYASSHQSPFYPGTGAASDTGVGNIVNAPLAAFTASAGFRAAYEERILPELAAFAPDLLIISAGFDAHRDDPLAQLNLEDEDYEWVTLRLMETVQASAGGRIVSVLEGGYDLAALARCVAGHVGVLMAA